MFNTYSDKEYRKTTIDWINGLPYNFCIAISLHLPNSYKSERHVWDSPALTKCLQYYFNCVDSKVLGSANRYKHLRVPRFITHEYKDTTGWHAHGLLSPDSTRLTAIEIMEHLETIWENKVLKEHKGGKLEKRLFYAEPVHGDYSAYITKSLATNDWPLAGQIDIQNCWLGRPSS